MHLSPPERKQYKSNPCNSTVARAASEVSDAPRVLSRATVVYSVGATLGTLLTGDDELPAGTHVRARRPGPLRALRRRARGASPRPACASGRVQ
jgi:hypothetical protein